MPNSHLQDPGLVVSAGLLAVGAATGLSAPHHPASYRRGGRRRRVANAACNGNSTARRIFPGGTAFPPHPARRPRPTIGPSSKRRTRPGRGRHHHRRPDEHLRASNRPGQSQFGDPRTTTIPWRSSFAVCRDTAASRHDARARARASSSRPTVSCFDQCACGRRRQRGHCQAHRSPRIQGQGAGRRPQVSDIAVAEDRRAWPAHGACRKLRSAAASAITCWPSASRSDWRKPPPRASSAPRAGLCPERATYRSSRPMPPSIPAIPAVRCSTRTAPWSASTHRSTATRVAIRECPLRFPSTLRWTLRARSSRPARSATPRLGVQVQTLDQSLADSFKMKAPNGALIAKIEPDSAAAQAGIKVGDVILKLDGHAIVDAGQLSARVGATAPGDRCNARDLARRQDPRR